MKICIFTHTFPRFKGDSAAPFMRELANQLTKFRNEVFVFTPFDKNLEIKNRQNKYQTITFKYFFPSSLQLLGYSRTLKNDRTLKLAVYLLGPFFLFFSFLSLLRFVKKNQIDIISAHWIIPNGFIAALVSKLTDVPYTITIPGSDIYLANKFKLFRWMSLFTANSASAIISDSSFYISQLSNLGFKPKKYFIIRYGIDTEKFKPEKRSSKLLKKFNLEPLSKIILAVGRLVSKKGFIYLIEAMPKILQATPDVRLLIVGQGDLEKDLRFAVKKLNLDQKVIFAGTISYDDLKDYYNLADLFVMPSIKDEKGNIDASPVAMMEAMACGKPVVATKFSGGEDIIIDGKTGYLIPEKNSSKLAESVIKLLVQSQNNTKNVNNIRKLAVANFSSKFTAKKYYQLFTSLYEK